MTQQFRDEHLDALRDVLEDLRMSIGNDPFSLGDGSLMSREFHKLEDNLDRSVDDFINGRASLSDSLEHIAEQLILFIDNADALLSDENPCKEVVRRRLAYLKRSIARRPPQPTLTEVLRLILSESDPYDLKFSPWAAEVVAHLNKENPEWVRTIARLPSPLKQNLLSLAEQARSKTNSLESEFYQIEQEIAHWFNQSMERASGVYRRNAKGIALLIGFLTAILINADTLHMVDRLSRDHALRSTITQTQTQEAVSPLQNEVPLPIGWGEANRTAQQGNSRAWRIPILRPLLGWLITGIALSMGATFWFDLLSRVIRVRSTGEKPEGRDR
ncbi:hypothetical protein [Egbenema bharatensis]|uniref:hypothetical protein n=1 Tax=Egbenema bharatensis TaxID=3463334 RepID=UPI003A89EB30